MLMRFDPFADLDRFSKEVWGSRTSVVPVDAYRLDDRFFLHLDLPGFDPDSIDLTVERNELTVKAERSWKPAEGATVLINERPQGTVTRRFMLGDNLDTDHIEAGYDHGVLTVVIPVAEQSKPRKISVGAGDRMLAG
jgi:HSP20 family protein